MIDELRDHLREHCRSWYERIRQPLPDSLPEGERAYQDWLAERHGPKIRRNLSTPEARAFWADVEAAAAEVRTWDDRRIAAALWAVRGHPATQADVDAVKQR